MGNRLEREQSPYLLQHANNPVDWYPWGPEALDRARREDKPVLVSIGYSACHWCHVMEHESFEDEATAQIMNDNFVNIKVDREERPDVDAVYMEAVQALTGQGGWPLNVFLTPDRRPFFGGTYFPPSAVHGMPSWTDVLQGIAQTYQEKREDVLHNADVLANYIAQAQRRSGSSDPIEPELLLQAYESIERQFDRERGGFGASPKFPQPLSLEFVLRAGRRFHDEAAQAFVLMTLQRMAAGGIYDQLGGGFHRYAVDANWVVPHFEKMLYDNALLASVYTNAYQLTKNMRFRTVAEETLDYMLRDLRSPHGGFYSSQDADSEGVEGKFYVWTRDQLVDILGEHDADLAAKRYGVTEAGNFQGATILTLAASDQELYDTEGGREVDLFERLRRIRATLLSARTQRIPPSTDTKILLGWNALAVRALAHAGRSLGREDYIDAAEATVAFLLHELCPAGRMVRSYRAGPGSVDAFLEDYAYLLESLLVLYESTFRSRYLQQARKLAEEMIERFHDDAQGAFFDTPEQETTLFVRPRGFFDNPIPSGNSSACFGLLRLEALTGESKFRDAALEVFRAVREVIGQAPLGFSHLLSALDFYLWTPAQIVIVGAEEDPDTGALVRCVSERYLPNSVMAAGQGDGSPLFAGKRAIGGRPTAFVCEHFSCHSPVTTVEELTAQLERL